MRVDLGPAEHVVDQIDQPIGDGVFEILGFIMDLRPTHPHDLYQEQLDQAMPAQDERRELLAGACQPHSRIRLVVGKAGFR